MPLARLHGQFGRKLRAHPTAIQLAEKVASLAPGPESPDDPSIEVIDTSTDEIAWGLSVDGHRTRPLAIESNPDGSPKKGRFGDMLRHPFSGVALCYKHGIPPEVMHIVATHSHEGDKVQRSIESIIFHHADFVDRGHAHIYQEGLRIPPVKIFDRGELRKPDLAVEEIPWRESVSAT